MSCGGCKNSVSNFIALTENEEELVDFLKQHNVILTEKFCPTCEKVCSLVTGSSNVWNFRCWTTIKPAKKKKKRQQCNFKESMRNNTFFADHRHSIPEICRFVMLDTINLNRDTAFLINEMSWSNQSVINFKLILREVYIDWTLTNGRPIIGGPGKIIEIDETQVGKRKHNCGLIVEGQWLYTAIEKDSGDFFIVPVKSLSKETLLSLIRDRVADGSTIVSDCWKAYNCLEDEGFQQQAVDHSKNFANTKSTTQKKKIDFLGYLAKFLFHKRFPNHTDRLHELFMAIGKLYDPTRDNVVVNNAIFDEDSDDFEWLE